MASPENFNQQQLGRFLHASPHAYRVGEHVEPGHERVSGEVGRAYIPGRDDENGHDTHVYFTDNLKAAKTFNSHVYEVEPTGDYRPDQHFPAYEGHSGHPATKEGEIWNPKHGSAMAYESPHPLRVTGVVLARKTKKLNYNNQLADRDWAEKFRAKRAAGEW